MQNKTSKNLDLAKWILIIQSSSISSFGFIAKNRVQSQVALTLYPEFVEGDTLGYSPFSACQQKNMKVSVWIPPARNAPCYWVVHVLSTLQGGPKVTSYDWSYPF